VIGRIALDKVQQDALFLVKKSTAHGVRLQAEAKKLAPIIKPPGPLTKCDTVGVSFGGWLGGGCHVDSLIG
jgi:hypothetical protein